MHDVQINISESGKEVFVIQENGKSIGEMEIGVKNNILTVFHTEVVPEMEGKGLGKKLFNFMVDHARKHQLKVRPLCLYTVSMLNKDPVKYADIWVKGGK